MLKFRRTFLTLSPAVREALSASKPVVALESTILTHGLPYPANLEMARQVEEVVRMEGAEPATIAFLGGRGHVGLDRQQLEHVSTAPDLAKISRRDIPSVVADGLSGGTTIASTMLLAHKAGIKVFGTGGLGGVHRGDAMDVSADLEELARTPVAVVCSGPKSILDVPRTLEYLETRGVPVYTQGRPGVQVPGFFTRESGVASPFAFEGARDAARKIASGEGLGMGSVFCVPCPEHLAMNPAVVNAAIELALAEAQVAGIGGKQLTPWLLKKVWEHTKGDTVQVNTEFVKNNARVAAQIAVELSRVGYEVLSPPPQTATPQTATPQTQTPQTGPQETSTTAVYSKSKVVVVGSIAQDLTCTLNTDNITVSSYPGRISTTIGGVAHNVALAATYTKTSTRLVSVVGDKEQGAIMGSMSPQLDKSGILVSPTARTARYVSTNDCNGDLIVACSDMESIDQMDVRHIRKQLERSDPEVVVFDGNIGRPQMECVLESKALKVFEPTSIPKSAKLAQLDLGVFPNNSVCFSSPNSMELMAMFEEFSYRDKFDVDRWFPIIDKIPMDQPVTQFKLQAFMQRAPAALGDIIQSGLVQAAIHLLPYVPNLFIKLGQHGVLAVQLMEGLRDRTADDKGANSVYIVGRNQPVGVLMQHFPIPETIPAEQVKSVNGIGDTFCGVLSAELARSQTWLHDDSVLKAETIERAQRAAALSLQTLQPVNKSISDLF